jgi:hypothetical protein
MAQIIKTISNTLGLFGGGENSRFENFVLGTSRFGWNTVKWYATKYINNGVTFNDVYSKNRSQLISNSLSISNLIKNIFILDGVWYRTPSSSTSWTANIETTTVWFDKTPATTTWS